MSALSRCVHQIQMSPSLPFTNVTPQWSGSGGGRARSPGVAQRPTGARCTGRSKLPPLVYRASVSSFGSQSSSADLEQAGVALDGGSPRRSLLLFEPPITGARFNGSSSKATGLAGSGLYRFAKGVNGPALVPPLPLSSLSP